MNRLLKIFFVVGLFQFLIPAHLFSSPDTARVRTFGGPGSEFGYDLQLTPDSGFIIAGTTNEYGAGNVSIYLVRTNNLGNHIWSKVLGGSQIDVARGVRNTYDSGYAISGFTNSSGHGGYDGYFIKTDSLGNELFEKTYGGSDWDFFYGIIDMPDSGYLLFGQTYSFTNGGADGYIVRINKE